MTSRIVPVFKWFDRWEADGASDEEIEDLLLDFFCTLYEEEPSDELRAEVKELITLRNKLNIIKDSL